MCAQRLTPQIWLDAGLEALIAQGPEALAAEPLARALNTTKGSFYWHFKDVPSFRAALLSHWVAATLSRLDSPLQEADPPDQSLRRFGHRLMGDPVEPQLRRWAQSDASVAASLRQVDERREALLAGLLARLGLANPDFARALLATAIGLPQLTPEVSARTAPFDTMVDMVLALARQ